MALARAMAGWELIARQGLWVPLSHRVRRPFGWVLLMALVAGVGGAQRDRAVGPWDAQAVVVARVNHHIRGRRHVARRARGALGPGLVVVVLRRVVFDREVALGAHRVARRLELLGVGVMAVAAGHALREHLAL